MMNTNRLDAASLLSDDDLLVRLEHHAAIGRASTADLIAHLAELTRRRSNRGEGEGTVFKHCTQVLKLSEAATFNRMAAAGAARKFPVILDMLADGSINLTTVRVLAGVLTAENYEATLREATGKGKEEIYKIKVRLEPKPAVAASVRKLPSSRTSQAAFEVLGAGVEPQSTDAPSSAMTGAPSPVATSAAAAGPQRREPIVQPLAPNRYKVALTIDDDTRDRLRRIQDLMRREIPSGDVAVIFARALVLMEQQAARRAFSATTRPRPSRGTTPGSRTVPAHVRRDVWARDGGRCAFVGRSGVRCSERTYLEFHHQDPYANGGPATLENIALRCRAHNVHESELIFGRFDPSPDREWLPGNANPAWSECQ